MKTILIWNFHFISKNKIRWCEK